MAREGIGVMEDKAPQAGVTPLSELVRVRAEELGLTLRRLEELCVDPTPDPGAEASTKRLWSRSTLSVLINGGHMKPPTAAKLRALAEGLDLPLDLVREAAGKQFFGVDTVWSPDRKVRAFVRDFEDMSAEDQAKVMALMEAHRRVQDV